MGTTESIVRCKRCRREGTELLSYIEIEYDLPGECPTCRGEIEIVEAHPKRCPRCLLPYREDGTNKYCEACNAALRFPIYCRRCKRVRWFNDSPCSAKGSEHGGDSAFGIRK